MAFDKPTMEFCIKNCRDAAGTPEQYADMSEFGKGQSRMAESLANQLEAILAGDQNAVQPTDPTV